MSSGLQKTSLDNLAHIANISHELLVLNSQLKQDESASAAPSRLDESKNDNPNVLLLKTGKPKKISCIECRQQKSRCDAYERHPNPCTRCSKKNLRCDIRSDYKRTYKRARIAQIEKEFSELKKSLTASQAAELMSKVPTLPNSGSISNGTHTSLQLLQHLQSYYQSQNADPSQTQGILQSQSQPPKLYDSINAGHIDSQNQQSFPTSQQASPPPLQHPFPRSKNQTLHETNRAVSLSPFNGDSSIPITPSIHNSTSAPLRPVNKSLTRPLIIQEQNLECEEKTLDTITLSPATIRSLYLEYVNRYHPILPVVDVSRGPERIFKLCPALFWVIMFVALRRYSGDTNKILLLTLSPLIKDILSEITISPITRYNPTEEDEPIINACSVYSVQAFLLYTFWPPLTSSLSADSSWNTIGVALFQAIRIGLHSPSLLSDHITGAKTPQQLSMAQEQAKTWIICNIASQSIATSFGFPAFVQFDSSIWSACRPASSVSIPKSIQYMMEIAHFEDQITKTLNSNSMDPYGLINSSERLPLLKVLSRQLDELEVKLVDELPVNDGFRIFQLLTARVHLFTYYFMDSERIAQFELSKGLVCLYNSTVALINHAQLCQARDPFFVKYLPVVYILNIWQASCIIAKLAHSPLKNVIDIAAGKQSYQAAILLAAKGSILKHDIAYRASGIMRNMWQLFRTLEEKNLTSLKINIRSRMSASVFFDSLFLLREQVGMIKLNSRTDENQANQANDNQDGDNSFDDDDDEDFDEEAVVSDNDEDGKRGLGDISKDDSNRSTPSGSNASSKTKRQRSLSNTVNAESKARRIIRTIPLDPQPISAPGKRSNIFKIVNNSSDSSPTVKHENNTPPNNDSPMSNSSHKNVSMTPTNLRSSDKQHLNHNTGQPHLPSQQLPNRAAAPTNNSKYSDRNTKSSAPLSNFPQGSDFGNKEPTKMAISGNSINRSNNKGNFQNFSNEHRSVNDNEMLPEMILHESPGHGGLENLEFEPLDMNSDLLWKDVDSVMNDFGFHTQ